MKVQANEVQAIYSKIHKQDMGKPFFVVITETDRAAMHERARLDIERIAQAAGVEMLKTASITVRRGMRQQQQKGLKELNTLLQEIRLEKTKKGRIHTDRHCDGIRQRYAPL